MDKPRFSRGSKNHGRTTVAGLAVVLAILAACSRPPNQETIKTEIVTALNQVSLRES